MSESATCTSRSWLTLPMLLKRMMYAPAGAFSMVNVPSSAVMAPMSSGVPLSGLTSTTLAKAMGSEVFLLKTAPVMLPSA